MKKGLKITLIVILVVVGIAAIAFFVKKDITVEREVTIKKPKQEVFDYIVQLKNQDNYSYWVQQDPGMKKEYRGIDGTVGFVSAWKGDKMGVGEQEIKAIVPGERVDYELRFKKPFESTNIAYMTTEAVSDTETKVKWNFKGEMPYLMLLFGMEGSLENDLQQGLDNLKALLEK